MVLAWALIETAANELLYDFVRLEERSRPCRLRELTGGRKDSELMRMACLLSSLVHVQDAGAIKDGQCTFPVVSPERPEVGTCRW